MASSRILFSSGWKHLPPRRTNEIILGGLASALGSVTHPIYSIIRGTLGSIIAFRWGINLRRHCWIINDWMECGENISFHCRFSNFVCGCGQEGKLNRSEVCNSNQLINTLSGRSLLIWCMWFIHNTLPILAPSPTVATSPLTLVVSAYLSASISPAWLPLEKSTTAVFTSVFLIKHGHREREYSL